MHEPVCASCGNSLGTGHALRCPRLTTNTTVTEADCLYSPSGLFGPTEDQLQRRIDALNQLLDQHGAPKVDSAGRVLNFVGRTDDLIYSLKRSNQILRDGLTETQRALKEEQHTAWHTHYEKLRAEIEFLTSALHSIRGVIFSGKRRRAQLTAINEIVGYAIYNDFKDSEAVREAGLEKP